MIIDEFILGKFVEELKNPVINPVMGSVNDPAFEEKWDEVIAEFTRWKASGASIWSASFMHILGLFTTRIL